MIHRRELLQLTGRVLSRLVLSLPLVLLPPRQPGNEAFLDLGHFLVSAYLPRGARLGRLAVAELAEVLLHHQPLQQQHTEKSPGAERQWLRLLRLGANACGTHVLGVLTT